jgi:hypothetical protein
MSDENPQGTLGQARPDDVAFAWGGSVRRWLEMLFTRGIPWASKFAGTLTIGTLTGYLKGTTGVVSAQAVPIPVADGGSGATTLTGLVKGNGTSAFTAVTAPSGAVVGTSDSQTLTNKTFDSTDTSTQPALTTLAAGANMALNVTGFTTQGTRVVVPTGGLIYGQINLTCNNVAGVAAGGTIATVTSTHRPPGTIAFDATKNAGGTYSTVSMFVTSGGLVSLSAALANTDFVVATASWMTS